MLHSKKKYLKLFTNAFLNSEMNLNSAEIYLDSSKIFTEKTV